MVSCCRLTLVLGFTFEFALPVHAGAQTAPRWNADVTVGGAVAKGGDFFSTGKAAAHVSLTVRVLQRERFAPYVETGYDWLGRFGLLGTNPDLTCIVDGPGGGCKPAYPDVTGPGASIGLLYDPSTRVETRIGVGGAAYSLGGTRVGAVVGHVDVAMFPGTAVGLILGARYAVIPRYRHERLTIVPMLLGLRIR